MEAHAMTPLKSGTRLAFGEFEADLRTHELRRGEAKVRLPDQSFRVLALLLERRGELVTREEIHQLLWPADTFVDFDHGLNNAVNRLREALGDSAEVPKFVETLPRRGYRFIGAVDAVDRTTTYSSRELQPLYQPGGNMIDPAGIESSEKANGMLRRWTLLAVATSAAIVLLLAIIVAVALSRRPSEVRPGQQRTIAVLPLQNASANKDFDFLRVGLADDIATTLSDQPAFSIRPYATTNKYAGADVDLQKAAREMQVADIITGHFLVAGDSIEVTLEVVDPVNNRVLWRDTIQNNARDLTGMQQQIAARVQKGLLAAFGISATASSASNLSHNAEAYELYLRALAAADQRAPQNPSWQIGLKDAISLLQRAVDLDPGYTSAWAALGHFYYYDVSFDQGGKESRLRAKAALQRAMALDPSRVDAATDLINMESEEGRLNESYDEIVQLLHKRPDSGAVHLVYGYVLWYAGLLDESKQECERARSLDPGTTDLASCGYIFMALGRYDRARAFFQLQSGTEYETAGLVEILLREGKQNDSFKMLRSLPSNAFYGSALLEPCLQHGAARNGVEIEKMRAQIMGNDDPFPKYLLAAWDSFCGEPSFADRELRRAIQQRYCAYPQIETDPLLVTLRARAEFSELRSLGMSCQQQFVDHRKQVTN
jgi:DNA-binding winged helix-turn-helix (wHTH) protein/TolB-like protein